MGVTIAIGAMTHKNKIVFLAVTDYYKENLCPI